MERVSPRTVGLWPQEMIRSVSSSLVRSGKPAARAFGSVFLRCAKAARTTRKNNASSGISQGGSLRVRSVRTAEVTFGCGIKQDAGTSNRISGTA